MKSTYVYANCKQEIKKQKAISFRIVLMTN